MLRIGIIGAGIGGLSAAVALHQAGFDANVYEQAPELTEVGGGINMGPNAVRVLRRLGLGSRLDHDGVRPLVTHQRRWQDGRTLQTAPLNPVCEQLYGAPQLTLHRRDLLAVIASGLPREHINLDHRRPASPSTATLSRPASTTARAFRSTCWSAPMASIRRSRQELFGNEEPVFAGCVAYRGMLRSNASPISVLTAATSHGSVRAPTLCIISCRADAC